MARVLPCAEGFVIQTTTEKPGDTLVVDGCAGKVTVCVDVPDITVQLPKGGEVGQEVCVIADAGSAPGGTTVIGGPFPLTDEPVHVDPGDVCCFVFSCDNQWARPCGGATGPTGPEGSTGATGPTGTCCGCDYGMFWTPQAIVNLDVTVNVAIAPNDPVPFINDGVTSNVARTGPGTFQVVDAGVYEIAWQLSVTAAVNPELALFVNGVLQPYTEIGSSLVAGELSGKALVPLSAGDTVELRNTSLATITLDGNLGLGQRPPTASLVIDRVCDVPAIG